MLIKKTIVLTLDSRTVGHLSIIRVGSETGAKLTLIKPMRGSIYIKIGGKGQERLDIDGIRSEKTLASSLESTDVIGAVLVDGEGSVHGKGGVSEIVSLKQVDEEKPKNEQLNTDLEAPKYEASEETGNEEEAAVRKEISEENEGEDKPEAPGSAIEEMAAMEEETEREEPFKEACSTEDSVPEEAPTAKEEGQESIAREPSTMPFNFIKGENFYKNVRGKLAEIMTANPTEERLEALIPDSKWVKVYYDKGEYYVVGILTEEGDVKFLAYGVPGVKSIKPPKDAVELCDFLEVKGGIGEGYWIMFQNAKNGEIVKSI